MLGLGWVLVLKNLPRQRQVLAHQTTKRQLGKQPVSGTTPERQRHTLIQLTMSELGTVSWGFWVDIGAQLDPILLRRIIVEDPCHASMFCL